VECDLASVEQKLVWIVRGVTLVLTTLALLSVMGAAADVIPPMG
jgi:hypothetical protein